MHIPDASITMLEAHKAAFEIFPLISQQDLELLHHND